MRIVFMGTPEFAVPALSELVAAGHEIAAVYTQPPRPRGRGHKLRPSPVGALAEEYGLEVRTPTTMKAPSEAAALAELKPDVAIVVAYGQILPQAVLDVPEHGCLNLHGSLLPRWRGAAPIQRAIMAGDKVTGVQVMRMEAGLDTGPVLLSETVPIADDETYQSLHDKLAPVGAGLLPRALAALERGGLQETVQSEDGVTYAKKITADEARIDWTQPASVIDPQIRGLSPFPGAFAQVAGDRVKLLMSAQGTSTEKTPGTVLSADEHGLSVACGEGTSLLVTRLQRAGKAAQNAEEFFRGFSIDPGTVLS
ncbi:methionyl-tRNA formyltransferase [Parvularcula sp. ZS-1/3]|uniref:Methionyl-tRNA formyltransferase n=1 Tax=Parvularcula mediterranea TaxID=2732508 RepID=A0A7Y3W4U5_9PROT|nr:methionyl-tRNA formyltransferase [Parvularcula mediterranea]NNU16130.1 methionyl-tRNA formyltransferase [Parvularcula mediterranea]